MQINSNPQIQKPTFKAELSISHVGGLKFTPKQERALIKLAIGLPGNRVKLIGICHGTDGYHIKGLKLVNSDKRDAVLYTTTWSKGLHTLNNPRALYGRACRFLTKLQKELTEQHFNLL